MVKKGFSLTEILVVMSIASILFATASKVMTTKPKPKIQYNPHGYYECFQSGIGGQRYRLVREGNLRSEGNGRCVFEPPVGVSFFEVNTYMNGLYHSSMEPFISANLSITVGGATVAITKVDDNSVLTLDNNSTEELQAAYFKHAHPTSQIYNVSKTPGVMISW